MLSNICSMFKHTIGISCRKQAMRMHFSPLIDSPSFMINKKERCEKNNSTNIMSYRFSNIIGTRRLSQSFNRKIKWITCERYVINASQRSFVTSS